ncbi:terminase [Paracidovorax avenae]|uniref:terminase small subunit n=1 Tax=Paracidovorax avenae TaxID=80867 RepID=UPI000D205FCC|nr:terminase small subunit [Paracidovorax avenae]AVS68142.1 terminase [Paracidovorax avenae]
MPTPPARKSAKPTPAAKKAAPATSKPKTPAARKPRAGSPAPASSEKPPKKARAPKSTSTPTAAPSNAPQDADTHPVVPAPASASALAVSPKQQRFIDEYLIDLNGTQAAIRAGYSAHTAAEQSYDLLRRPQIQAAIAEARKAQQERTQISADRVVLEAWNIVTADPRDLVQVKVGCCRYCHGEGHKRQRTLAEYNTERSRFRATGGKDVDWEEEGGIGYSPLRAPHPLCPECHGDGCPRVVLGDTRSLSPATLALYAGAKHGKHGIEVQMHDKGVFAEKLFRHLGLYEKDNQQQTDPLAALLHAIAGGASNGFAPKAVDPERPVAGDRPSAFLPRPDAERD